MLQRLCVIGLLLLWYYLYSSSVRNIYMELFQDFDVGSSDFLRGLMIPGDNANENQVSPKGVSSGKFHFSKPMIPGSERSRA
jgi:hypothetical protein